MYTRRFLACHTVPHTHTNTPQTTPQTPHALPHTKQHATSFGDTTHHIQEGHGYSCRLPALVLDHFDIQSRRGYDYESHGFSCRSPVLVLNFTPLDIESTARESRCVNTISDHRVKQHKKSSPTCPSTPWPSMKHITLSPPPGNPNTIQYLIPWRATNVELLKQVKIGKVPCGTLGQIV